MVEISRYPNFSIKSYLSQCQLPFKIHETGEHDELAIDCPTCVSNGEKRPDTKQRLWINASTGDFYCYNCTWSGQLPRLVQALSHTSLLGALRIMKGKTSELELLNYRLSNEVDFTFKELDEEDVTLPECQFPHGFEFFSETRKKKTIFHKYLAKRGISLDYACELGWGFSTVGYTANRIIVPSFMDDRLVLWQARDVLEEKHPSWGDKQVYRKVLNPKGVSKAKVLYNFDVAREHEEIILCEGFIDAAKAGENAVAINGKTLHAAQLEALSRTKAKSIVLLLDPDAFTDEKRYVNGPKKGRVRKPSSVEKARSMLSVLFDVRTVRLPDGMDAGKYTHEELRQIIDTRRRRA